MNLGELEAICVGILLFAICLLLTAAGCDMLVDFLVRPSRPKRRVGKHR
jgi:hypothetical protein